MSQQSGEALRGPACPVCGVDADELVSEESVLEKTGVAGRVQERFPGWQPEDGLCRPCLELFRAGS